MRPRRAAFELPDARAVIGVDREHEAVEEPPPLGRRPGEQGIHRRRQPDDPHVVAERARGGDGRPVDAVEPLGFVASGAALPARAELVGLAVLLDFGGERKAAGAADPRAFRKLRPAQPAPGREQRQRFEEIGLARAVLAA